MKGAWMADAASGGTLVGVTEGVFILPKKTTAVIAAGGRVSWENTAHQCDAPSAGLHPGGVAVESAGASTFTVRLDGMSTVEVTQGSAGVGQEGWAVVPPVLMPD